MYSSLVHPLMRMVLLAVLVLSALCAWAVVGAGGPTPTTASADAARLGLGFGAPGCALPCFAGIDIGVTAFEDAPDLLSANIPGIEPRMYVSGSGINFWAQSEGRRMSGTVSYRAGRVQSLRLISPFPSAWLLEAFGAPDCTMTTINEGGDPLRYFFWFRHGVIVGAVSQQADPFHETSGGIHSFWVSAYDAADCSQFESVPWRGFAPAWRYEHWENETSRAGRDVVGS